FAVSSFGDFAVYTDGGFIGFWSGLSGTNDNDLSTTQINDNLWHQITISNDGVTAVLYVDGISVGGTIDTSGGFGMDAFNVHIGSISLEGSPQQYHQGLFDEVRFFDRALTVQEVSDLYVQTDTDTVAITVNDDVVAPVVTIDPLTTNDTQPALSGTVDDTAATINVNVNLVNYAATNNGNGTWSLGAGIIAALPEGTYEVLVTATDPSGNIGTDGTTLELVIDLTGPSAPVVDALTTNDTTPILTGTYDSADSGGGLSVAVNGVTYVLGVDAELTAPVTGDVISSFTGAFLVEPDAGLAWDGTNLWLSEKSTPLIYELSTTGTVLSSFTPPGSSPAGMTWDGTNLWLADKGTDLIYKLDTAGNVLSSFAAPGADTRGITWDGSNLWVADTGTDLIYKLDATGGVLSSFAAPSADPVGLTWDGTNLWVADKNTNLIYEITTTGTVLSSFFVDKAQGLTFDGTDFWYAKNQGDIISQLEGPATTGDDWTLDLSAITPLTEATYEVTAIATDAAGNTGTDVTSLELVIDTTDPVVT
ncbi:MAG: Ig-like domain-containing protein, partial [Acidimicrobiia bacterium]